MESIESTRQGDSNPLQWERPEAHAIPPNLDISLAPAIVAQTPNNSHHASQPVSIDTILSVIGPL